MICREIKKFLSQPKTQFKIAAASILYLVIRDAYVTIYLAFNANVANLAYFAVYFVLNLLGFIIPGFYVLKCLTKSENDTNGSTSGSLSENNDSHTVWTWFTKVACCFYYSWFIKQNPPTNNHAGRTFATWFLHCFWIFSNWLTLYTFIQNAPVLILALEVVYWVVAIWLITFFLVIFNRPIRTRLMYLNIMVLLLIGLVLTFDISTDVWAYLCTDYFDEVANEGTANTELHLAETESAASNYEHAKLRIQKTLQKIKIQQMYGENSMTQNFTSSDIGICNDADDENQDYEKDVWWIDLENLYSSHSIGLLRCAHSFHLEWIITWIKVKQEWPLWKKHSTVKDILEIL